VHCTCAGWPGVQTEQPTRCHGKSRIAADTISRWTQSNTTCRNLAFPLAWYNIAADLPKPMAPPLHPGTLQPIGPADLAPLFPMALIMQEVSTEREIEIPGRSAPDLRPVASRAALSRPPPGAGPGYACPYLLQSTKASAPLAHTEPNTAVRLRHLHKKEGTKRLSTETGAGSGIVVGHGLRLLRLECKVYMVRVSYDQKPYRRRHDGTFGAICHRQSQHRNRVRPRHSGPVIPTSTGRSELQSQRPSRFAAKDPNTKYALGAY